MNIINLIILFACGIQLLFQIFYLFGGSMIKSIDIKDKNSVISISVLICAKNEMENLKKNLPFFRQLNWDKIDLELIIVDDGSTDNSLEYLTAFEKEFPYCRIISLPQNMIKDLPGKKYALREGVLNCTKDYILLTDADCIPRSKEWIQSFAEKIHETKADIILGFGPYEQRSSFLNHFIQFETLHTVIQYMTYASFRLAYMGVGRNLMYKKSYLVNAFKDENLLTQLKKTSSGDDDLIINYYSKKANIWCLINEQSQTISSAPTNWKSYFKQKSRHTSSAKYYHSFTKILLGLYAFSHFLFWMGMIISIIFILDNPRNEMSEILGFSYIIVLLMKCLTYGNWKKLSAQNISIIKLLGLDFFWSIYNVILSPYIFWKNKSSWN